jgi:hypothetical protein
VSVELDKFVLLVFEHIGGPEGGFEQVTFERLQPVLFDTPLLLQFLSARIGEQRYHQPPTTFLSMRPFFRAFPITTAQCWLT